jgi:hypothetical protein
MAGSGDALRVLALVLTLAKESSAAQHRAVLTAAGVWLHGA